MNYHDKQHRLKMLDQCLSVLAAREESVGCDPEIYYIYDEIEKIKKEIEETPHD